MKGRLIIFLLAFSPFLAFTQDLFDQGTLRSLSLEFYDENWDNILTQSWEDDTGIRLPAIMTIDGVGVFDSVNVRYKGNSTFAIPNNTNNPKKPWNIDVDDFIDQDVLGIDKIKLANGFFDPSLLREVMGYDIYGKYLPSPRANHMKVYLENEYLGLYVNTETIDKTFLKRHFDYKKGTLFKCDPSLQFGQAGDWDSPDLAWYGSDSTNYLTRYDLKTDEGWSDLIDFIEVLNFNADDLENHLNIDRVLWYLAATMVMCNFDSYPGVYIHNYYFYLHENGLWQIIPWDVSEAFMGVLEQNEFVSENEMYSWDIYMESDPTWFGRPLMDAILANPLYKRQYLAHIRTVIEESVNEEAIQALGIEIQDVIQEAAEEDDENFFGWGSFFFESNLEDRSSLFFIENPGILDVVERRLEFLNGHPDVQLVGPEIISVLRDIDVPVPNQDVTIVTQVIDATTVDLMVSKNEWASHFEAIPMTTTDGMFYTATIPYTNDHEEVHYYIRAQNDDAMALSPARAEYEFYSYLIDGFVSTDLVLSSDFGIYPNPADDFIHLEFDEKLVGLNSRVYNANGQFVKDYLLTSSKMKMPTHDLLNGVYFIQCADKFGRFSVHHY